MLNDTGNCGRVLSPQKPEGPQRNDSGGRPIDAVTDYEVGSFPRLPRPADLDGELIVYCEIRGPFVRDGVDCHPGGLKCAGCKGFAGITFASA